ncbi:hypothetical protein CEXT_719171 [Caerostris extrusa]|uniref:Uncharacterized protein n=1 Tax=Caerostris extrusa TaxID=172846 RepID=A0AAV4MUA6_CAEEX|nr:hypothetical protein CEXT_719171 [Caerostris extrusa]
MRHGYGAGHTSRIGCVVLKIYIYLYPVPVCSEARRKQLKASRTSRVPPLGGVGEMVKEKNTNERVEGVGQQQTNGYLSCQMRKTSVEKEISQHRGVQHQFALVNPKENTTKPTALMGSRHGEAKMLFLESALLNISIKSAGPPK